MTFFEDLIKSLRSFNQSQEGTCFVYFLSTRHSERLRKAMTGEVE